MATEAGDGYSDRLLVGAICLSEGTAEQQLLALT